MEDEDLLRQGEVSRAVHRRHLDLRPTYPPPLAEIGHDYALLAGFEEKFAPAPARQPLGVEVFKFGRRQGDGCFVVIDARHISSFQSGVGVTAEPLENCDLAGT
jgi:hypothetical protein